MKKLIFLFALMGSPTTYASETPATLEDIVISASQYTQSLSQTSQNITIIQGKDLENKGTPKLSDILRENPGIDIVSLGTPGEDLDLRLRGSDRDEVLLMIDGLVLNDIIDARPLVLDTIPLDIIERVEILRGPNSVLYGSNAVGGIINIITRKNNLKSKRQVSLGAGNLGQFAENIFLSHKMGQSEFALAYDRNDQKGRFENDRYAKNSVFASHHYAFDWGQLDTRFIYLGTSQELAFEAITGAAMPIPVYVVPDKNRSIKRNIFIPSIELGFNPLPWYQSKLRYGLFLQQNTLENSNQGETTLIAGTTRGSQHFTSSAQRHSLDWQNHFLTAEHDNFTNKTLVGLGLDIETLKYRDEPFASDITAQPTTIYPDSALGQKGSRTNLAAYFQNTSELWDKIFVSAGIRFDRNSTYGKAVSPRVSAAYFNETLKTKFYSGFSMGFKAPTINQYYLSLTDGTGIQLKQNLSVEKSHTLEIGIENSLIPFTQIKGSFFHTDYKNLIDELALVPQAEVQGVETDITFKPASWIHIGANYTFTKSHNEALSTELASRPTHHFNTSLNWLPTRQITFAIETNTVSKRKLASVLSTEAFGDLPFAYFKSNGTAVGTALPGYTLVNLSAKWELPYKTKTFKNLTSYIRAGNVFNKNYQDSPGYPSPGFNFFGGLSATF